MIVTTCVEGSRGSHYNVVPREVAVNDELLKFCNQTKKLMSMMEF